MSDCDDPRQDADAPTKYWGKYRGVVVENVDPLFMGRMLVRVDQVPGTAENWAMPCVPYAGPEVGFFMIPELMANVWVEYEGGDPSFPIWTGCFWQEGEVPMPWALDPLNKFIRTESSMLLFNDTPEVGGITLMTEPPAVDDVITLEFSSEGVLITAPPAVFNMSIEAGITLEFPPCVISMTEVESSSLIGETVFSMTEEATVLTSPAVSVDAEGVIALDAAADVSIDAAGSITMAAPAMDITAAGAEWLGDLNLTGAMEVEGNVNILGAVEVEGEMNNLGAVTVEGDHNILGSAQIEGALTVLGIITMDGMPVLVFPL